MMHHCLVFRVHVLWMSCLYVVRVAALWMLRVQLLAYVGQIWMQTLHFHFGCKVERPPEEQQRLQFAQVRPATLHYGCMVLRGMRYAHPQPPGVCLMRCCFVD